MAHRLEWVGPGEGDRGICRDRECEGVVVKSRPDTTNLSEETNWQEFYEILEILEREEVVACR